MLNQALAENVDAMTSVLFGVEAIHKAELGAVPLILCCSYFI
jgi:hypothetical protein